MGAETLLEEVVGHLDADRDQGTMHVRHGVMEPGEPDLNCYRILEKVGAGLKHSLVDTAKQDKVLDRVMGSLCGMAVGDALGCPFEFIPASDEPTGSRFDLETKEFHCEFNKFHMERGQWTDDASMGLCMADSLIMRRAFDGSDMRVRFWCWWFRGYNNAFRLDADRPSKASIGLGGNVGGSLRQLAELEADDDGRIVSVPPVFEAQNEDAGNGSLMRLAPVPIFFCSASSDRLYQVASLSSRTTHPGAVAGEACAALAHVIARAITRPTGDARDARRFLDETIGEYLSAFTLRDKSGPGYDELKSLLASAPLRDEEGCWDWRSDKLKVQSSLVARGYSYNGYPVSADYFGSYCLDGLAVALWCCYHTSSFDEAVVRAANVLGDADSHASMTGQIAGAFYGYSTINDKFLEWLNKWDAGEIAVRALLLYHLGQQANDDRK